MSEATKGLSPATKEPKKFYKVEKVVKNPVKVKKKGKFAKLVDQFFVEDLKSVWSWGLTEVIIPSLKRLFVEFIDNSVNSMVYGKGANNKIKGSTVGNVSYREYWDRPRTRDYYSSSREQEEMYAKRHDDVYGYGEYYIRTEDETKKVLRTMQQCIDTYGLLTVAHFLQMVGVDPRSTDYNYGWTSVNGVTYTILSDGWCRISLPRVMPIE